MNYLDLFSGIGGFHEGLRQSGFKFDWVGHSEIDKYANQIYENHFPGSEDLGDVRSINPRKLPRINLVTFGFPCQDLSIAGKRRGLAGERSGLFSEAIRIIGACRPEYFIFENVKGLFSSDEGRDFERVLRAIADIGYDGQWQLLNTRWVLPQNRERIFFVGYPRGRGRPEIFPIGEDGQVFNGSQGEAQIGGERVRGKCASSLGLGGSFGERNLIARTVSSRYGKDGSENLLRVTGNNKASQYCENVDIVSSLKATNQSNARSGGTTLVGQVVPCIRSEHHNITDVHFIQKNTGIRRLTPLECERLQGFPDGWTSGVSDTQRYKCLGNAVTVPIVKLIGDKLSEATPAPVAILGGRSHG